MTCVSITIDPALRAWRPEITWAWQTILTTIGWCWQETPAGTPCDILYAPTAPEAGQALLWIRAEPEKWASWPALVGVQQIDTLCLPLYAGESAIDLRALVQESNGIARAVRVQRDIVFDLFWMTTGGAEQGVPLDKHANLLLWSNEQPQRTLWLEGAASTVIAWIEACGERLGWPVPDARWPNGATAAAAAGHDVDYPEVYRWLEPARILARQGRRGIGPAWQVATGKRHHWHFAEWMELEQSLGGRSVFFFVPRQGSLWQYARGLPDPFYDVTSPRFRTLFRTLTDNGFEVGLHASYLAYRSAAAMRAEKERLEAAAEHPVIGNRHHYWHMKPGAPDDTLLVHEEAGLLYDTSLTNDRYLGWRRGLCTPYAPFHRGERRAVRMVQIGTAWMDDQIFGGAAHNPGEPIGQLRALAERAKRMQGCLLVDIHDYVYDDALFVGWKSAYASLWSYLRVLGGFWLATPAEIARHWQERTARIAAASSGLTIEETTGGRERALHLWPLGGN